MFPCLFVPRPPTAPPRRTTQRPTTPVSPSPSSLFVSFFNFFLNKNGGNEISPSLATHKRDLHYALFLSFSLACPGYQLKKKNNNNLRHLRRSLVHPSRPNARTRPSAATHRLTGCRCGCVCGCASSRRTCRCARRRGRGDPQRRRGVIPDCTIMSLWSILILPQ